MCSIENLKQKYLSEGNSPDGLKIFDWLNDNGNLLIWHDAEDPPKLENGDLQSFKDRLIKKCEEEMKTADEDIKQCDGSRLYTLQKIYSTGRWHCAHLLKTWIETDDEVEDTELAQTNEALEAVLREARDALKAMLEKVDRDNSDSAWWYTMSDEVEDMEHVVAKIDAVLAEKHTMSKEDFKSGCKQVSDEIDAVLENTHEK